METLNNRIKAKKQRAESNGGVVGELNTLHSNLPFETANLGFDPNSRHVGVYISPSSFQVSSSEAGLLQVFGGLAGCLSMQTDLGSILLAFVFKVVVYAL